LDFDDETSAAQTLSALRSRTHVETACLYKRNGTQLATYKRAGYTESCPSPAGETVQFSLSRLVISHEIQNAGSFAGTLVVVYDLGEIPERMRLYGALVLLTLIVASAIAVILSYKLLALLAAPILELAHAANTVSRRKDYGIRIRKVTDDEIGTMVEALNQMLDGIQFRDEELRKALAAQRESMLQLSQLNSELNRSNKELARSNHDLERFAFVASHDLQEPLRMITTYSELLVAEHPNPTGDEAQYLGYVTSGTTRMRELLADLLDYTEVAGTTGQPAESVDLNAVLRKVREALGARVMETQAEITVDSLPVLQAHESRMISVFLNLVGNALKYKSDVPPRIRVWAQATETEWTFAVADNGIGIAPEYHDKIFEPFRRLHGRDIPGTGIGLAICQRIVERYGGRIWVESAVGSGATFRFTLPKALELDVAESRAATA
jgi:signal transduction histidine kinase